MAFTSSASNLTADPQGPGGYNGTSDAFVRSPLGVIRKADFAADGSDADDAVSVPRLSADGRYLTFYSAARDLLPGRVAPAGRYNVYWRDLVTGETRLVSSMPDGSFPTDDAVSPDISDDGRFVAFEADDNLMPPPQRGFAQSVYVRDMVTGVLQIASVDAAGGPLGNCTTARPRLDAAGDKVVFDCEAAASDGTPSVFVRDLSQNTTQMVSLDYTTQRAVIGADPAIDAAGDVVVFIGRPLGSPMRYDVYSADSNGGPLTVLSRRPNGTSSNGSALWAEISSNGQIVTFSSDATDLVPGGPTSGTLNVYAVDRATSRTYWISQGNLGAEPDAGSGTAVAYDGINAIFGSNADNLVAGDTNGATDIFQRRMAILPDLRANSVEIPANATGSRAALVPVTVSQPLGAPTSVSWQITNGSARYGTDYAGATSGTAVIPAGATSTSIPILVLAGANPGTLQISISTTSNLAITGHISQVTIT